MTEEEEFKKLFQKIVELYQISSDTAAELLQRILAILSESCEENETTEERKE